MRPIAATVGVGGTWLTSGSAPPPPAICRVAGKEDAQATMALDHAGALLISVAFLMLIARFISALVQRQNIKAALRQHHGQPAPAPGFVSRATQRVRRAPD